MAISVGAACPVRGHTERRRSERSVRHCGSSSAAQRSVLWRFCLCSRQRARETRQSCVEFRSRAALSFFGATKRRDALSYALFDVPRFLPRLAPSLPRTDARSPAENPKRKKVLKHGPPAKIENSSSSAFYSAMGSSQVRPFEDQRSSRLADAFLRSDTVL
ncbi:hypothetical protein PHSY_001596 [Pseudozyma hubeiensis SY62]|uniref:Uncharacterized protein n=1 Tax=Pseudozyma hubeiensis (strain SY62) TaxID=1305764 RepID=R9NZA5_PSEHS|nr:hypothetical protein PHSY_001596 [Pseudozyma hubeiensis SY62]GAC94027.1 hypothetical protein PHSY_001596 [Pseudozyma hubeiensis SY62]